MWTKMMSGPRKKAPKTIAVIDPDRCFGAFACSICQAACPVAGCIVEEKDRDGRMVCAVRADLCIGCGLCVTLGNPTAPQVREFGCPPDYDAINMMPFELVVQVLQASDKEETTTSAAAILLEPVGLDLSRALPPATISFNPTPCTAPHGVHSVHLRAAALAHHLVVLGVARAFARFRRGKR